MSYRVAGLDPAPFRPLYGLGEAALAERGAIRMVADSRPGFPDRIELRDVAVGETVLLVNFVHQPAATPYRASHAIFVREGAEAAAETLGVLPEALAIRPLSLRGFDNRGMMADAALVAPGEAEAAVLRLLERPEVAYLHAHYATRGCYAARIDRV
ncbi:MAG: DUF1203 domain-containing protein [Alphaproteobacteria bacterium]|nr:DUF1203 domain-containing protein [Alphaproteobacteria bacterium]MBV9372108.1 DUF1203 domain-containing protein [Alphaproteobacteria bacterium]MBV9899860.1 DUF1203 domain-containing protein [Alphaproteobacteria bacterium]